MAMLPGFYDVYDHKDLLKDDDASAMINAAIADIGARGGTVVFGDAVYGIGTPIDGHAKNVRFLGLKGATVFRKLSTSTTASMLTTDAGDYEGYTFEGIEFDGNAAVVSALPGLSINMTNWRSVTFSGCSFRGLTHPVQGAGSSDISFSNCAFYGTAKGTMERSTMKPPANPMARYAPGAQVSVAADNYRFDSCSFHFTSAGISGTANQQAHARVLNVHDCSFRGDWWNSPYVVRRFRPTAYDATRRLLTVADGGLLDSIPEGAVCSVPILVAEGRGELSGFQRLYAGEVHGRFHAPRAGDVIETADGRRAEIVSTAGPVADAADVWAVWIGRWESIDTFEPTSPPAIDVEWELVRFYASAVSDKARAQSFSAISETEVEGAELADAEAGDTIIVAGGATAIVDAVESPSKVRIKAWVPAMPAPSSAWVLRSDTTIKLYSDPVNPHSGETLSQSAEDLVGIECRMFASLGYSGIHLHAGHDVVEIRDNLFRGIRNDQCSVFDSEAPRIINNHFEYGQDEGITATRCPRTVIMGNTFRFCGTSAIFLGSSPLTVVSGNTIHGWGLTNPFIRGAIEGAAQGATISGNSVSVPPSATKRAGSWAHVVGLYGSSSQGSVIYGNTKTEAAIGGLSTEPVSGAVTARDVGD
jgi:Right handed beta helix region